MSNSLFSSLTQLLDGPTVQSLASRVGGSEESVARAIRPTLAVILHGIIEKTKDATVSREIFEMIKRVPIGDTTGAGVSNFAAESSIASLADIGGHFLQMIFGGDQHAAAGTIARISDLPSGAAARLMMLAATMVLGLLSRRVQDRNLSLAGFEKLLQRESSEIKSYLPAGLNNARGAATSGVAALSSTAPSDEEEPGRRPWWLLPAIAALALLFGVFWFAQKPRVPSSRANFTREGATRARAAIPELGAFVERRLPDGVSLTIPENGVELRLLSFIETSSQPSENTWFDFDRLTFDTGSAILRPESEEQLHNIASIMKAFPNLRLKISGYTDNTGSSKANLRLSQNRAGAVTRELTGMGVAPHRLEGEGYGDRHPIADNSTEEGRAKNRRISMRVLKK
jgi:OmpA-OmpF porin, OOP family